MTERNQLFAFVAGEVSKQFYGRRDLTKYPFGLSLLENFYVDYRGGIFNRSGTEHIVDLEDAPHKFSRFKTITGDITLLFYKGSMYVLRNGEFALTGSEATGTVTNEGTGEVTVSGSYSVGQMVKVENGPLATYAIIESVASGKFTIGGRFFLDNALSTKVQKIYTISTGITDEVLSSISLYQDLDTMVITSTSIKQKYLKRNADNDWELSEFINDLPDAPTGVAAVASDTGSGSVAVCVTAVVDGVESKSSTIVVLDDIISYTTLEGFVRISWNAVDGADYYNVYSTLLTYAGYEAGASFGYIGYTEGLAFENLNITPDFTKSPPTLAGYFRNSNYPAVYCRFQQRGVYAGLKNSPLDVVGSIVNDKRIFAKSRTPTAADSYRYTLDAETEKPIKHILPLRYGLMCFTDDSITQLRGGGDANVLTPLSAIAEVQAYAPISNVSPVAINLDLLFLTALNTELNAMIYTEYVNSFKMSNVMVLASHMFSKDNKATQMYWAAEPYKLLHFVREDGQRVSMTYEREQDIFAWARHKTAGRYVNTCVISEENESICYMSVLRKQVSSTPFEIERLSIEREKPRSETRVDRFFFVDTGKEFSNKTYTTSAKFVAVDETRRDWIAYGLEVVALEEGNIVYANGVKFFVTSVNINGTIVHLTPANAVQENILDGDGTMFVAAGNWWTGPELTEVGGLYWLEGKKVSVYADGNCYPDMVVSGGKITLPSPAIYVVVGLPYTSRARTLPLGLASYNVDGDKLNLRGIAVRQSETRGLKVGDAFDNMMELPTRQDEPWGGDLSQFTELTLVDNFGFLGSFETEKFICFEQSDPLPAMVVGVTFNLDVGT